MRKHWNRINCPPHPNNPALIPKTIERLFVSSFQPTIFKATIATGTMVKAQAAYPSVAGKPAFSGSSIKAPQMPHKTVVVKA
jgi:hypothetical protein